MFNKTLLIGICLVLVLVASLYTVLSITYGPAAEMNTGNGFMVSGLPIETADDCMETDDPDFCRARFYSFEAFMTDDVSMCDNLAGDFRQECIDTYHLKKALNTGNLAHCDDSSDPEFCRESYHYALEQMPNLADFN